MKSVRPSPTLSEMSLLLRSAKRKERTELLAAKFAEAKMRLVAAKRHASASESAKLRVQVWSEAIKRDKISHQPHKVRAPHAAPKLD